MEAVRQTVTMFEGHGSFIAEARSWLMDVEPVHAQDYVETAYVGYETNDSADVGAMFNGYIHSLLELSYELPIC